jgi:hypothetical protein
VRGQVVINEFQERLNSHIRKEILAELRTPDHLRENLDVVDVVLGFLSSGGGKADKKLGEYVDKVLKMRRRPFSQKVSWCNVAVVWHHCLESLI